MGGVFTISLDFELHWGVFDKRNREERRGVYDTTVAVVPRMLELFEKSGVHVTWATVGSMFARNRAQWEQLKPSILPKYTTEKYSAYRYIDENGLNEESYFAHFAPDVIKMIKNYRGQEIGTHTFSHYYCLEEQHEPGAFEADLRAAVKTAAAAGVSLRSLVFPRNQFNPDTLKTCYDLGITAVRSNPDTWFWNPVKDKGSSLVRKIIRSSDAYIQLGDKRTSYHLSTIANSPGLPLCLPSSRFLRPWNPQYQFANGLRINRINNEIKAAAKNNECYHLWWHPENFGTFADKNIESLRRILKTFEYCRERYNMKSWNMGEYAGNLNGTVKTASHATVHL